MTEWAAILNLSLLMGALVAVTSGIIHGYTGFGAALFMTPLFAILFGPVEAIGVGSVIGFCGSAQLYPGAARNAVWRELIPIFAGIVIMTPFGAILLFKTDPELIRRAMGVLILLFALILISGWVYRGPRGPVSSAAVGALAGGITGAAGVGGPPLALYFLSSPASPEVQRGNTVIAVAMLIVVALASISIAGGFTADTLLRAVILIPVYVIGTWSGAKLFGLAPKAYFRRVALWLLVATGIGVFLL